MGPTGYSLLAVALFLVGIRLSAFFSGCETGFYRLNFLRLGVDAHAGDRKARKLLWFSRNPGYFVATTLVGNNVSNYLTTAAVGVLGASLALDRSGSFEVAATLAIAPLVFVFGELIPKSLYYRAPLKLLRRDVWVFTFFYRVFLLVSYPLVLVTKLLERFASEDDDSLRMVLGRNRLVQVLRQGHRHGLLTDAQSRLLHGLLQTAAQPALTTITPVDRVLGLEPDAGRDEVLQFARQYGVASVILRTGVQADDWAGYVRVMDLAITGQTPSRLLRKLPQISEHSTRLEALIALRLQHAAFGMVVSDGRVLGTISEHGLLEQLFRGAPAARAGRVISGP